MVGLVIVSHSRRLAEGAAELARQMAGEDVAVEIAGGLDEPGHPIGTDAMLVRAAIDRAWSDDGVLVLMDLGSAVLSAEMALDFVAPERLGRIRLTHAPLVEGAVAAAVTARSGAPLDRVAAEAEGGLAGKAAHLGAGGAGDDGPAVTIPRGPTVTIELVVDLPHGLHARPAARLVQEASRFDADVRVRNATTGAGPVSARSLNAVATLGVTAGQTLEVSAGGPRADEALAAIAALGRRRFDEGEEDLAAADAPPPAPGARPGAQEAEGVLVGIAAAAGTAVGPARRFRVPALPLPSREAADADAERDRLGSALRAARDDVARQRDDARARIGHVRAAIFDAHLLFLDDPAILEPVRAAIDRGATAAAAWSDAVASLARTWDGLDDPYLRERADDLRSVGRQVLARLLGVEVPRPALAAPGVLLARDLEPADAAGLDPATCLAIATERGGPTSHAAVVARGLGVPAVVGLGAGLAAVPEGTTLAVDGETGVVRVDPSAEVVARLEAAREARAARDAAARRAAESPAVTADGVTIEVAANIGGPGDVPAAIAAGCDGVGLFRTELLFMGRATIPSEDEQEAVYREVAEALGGRPLVVRTLDAGADKPVPALDQPPEPNPFLGLRGVRLGLARREVLDPQLRALVRVAADHPIRVMFPMVATRDELRAARDALARAREAVGGGDPEVGVMIEVPSAALVAEHLAPEVDFFSVGTNDLTQYALAADRGNERVAALGDPLHPAVLRLIGMACRAASGRDVWVGVCGELAGDPSATGLLLGLGVRELSMGAPSIPLVKEAVRAVALEGADALARAALAEADGAAVRALLGAAT